MDITGQQIGLLGQRLRAARWKVGTAHEIDAERLLQQLRVMDALPHGIGSLAVYLGPIFCSEPDHQAAFEGHLREVLASDAELQPDGINPDGAKIAGAGPWLGWLLSLALLVIVGLIAWGLIHRYEQHVVTVRVLQNKALLDGAQVTLSSPPQTAVTHDGKAQVRLSRADLEDGVGGASLRVEKFGLLPSTRQLATLPEGEIEVELAPEPPRAPPPAPPTADTQRSWSHDPRPRQDDPKWHEEKTWRLSHAGLLAMAAPLLLAAAWAVFWWLHRRAWLQRLPRQTPQSITELSSRTRRTLAMYLDTGGAGHELRRRRWQDSPELNLEATLRGTLEKAGQPRLVFGSRIEPEYLALIDEGSSLDHMARLADELMLSLEARDVAIERYFFRGDPTILSGPAHERKPRAPSLPLLTLEQLATTHLDRRLIIVSDGGGLFDPGTGYRLPCADTLLQWADVVLLTPTRSAQWGRREWALSRLGFTVLPLNGEGLMAMGELHASGKAAEPPQAAAAHRAPPRWVREPLAMLLPSVPQGTTTARLCDELRDYLGSDAYVWLQACAVYPEMHWGMTLRLGAGLLDPGPRYTRALSLLVRLPWLRESYMPNWLREALRERLGGEDALRVSDVIRQILEQARLGRGGDLELRVGAPPKEAAWPARRDRPTSPPPPPSPPAPGPRRIHRDAVFLRFMQGPPRLAVPAVDWLRRLFFRDGLWSLGLRGLPIVMVAAMAAALAGFYVPPYSIDSRVVLDKADKPATVTALTVAEGGEQPTVMVGYSNGEVWRVTHARTDRWSTADEAVTGFLHAGPERGAFRVRSGATMAWGAEPAASAARADLPAGGRPLFDPQGRLQALLSVDGTNLRWPDANGRTDAQIPIPISQEAGTLRCAAIAFDGSVVAVVDAKLHTVRRASPSAPPVTVPIVTGCDLRPGGRVVVGWEPDAGTGGVSLWRYDLHARRFERAVPMKDARAIDEFLAAADGNKVWVRQGTEVSAFDIVDSRMHQALPAPAMRMAVTADANGVAIATPDGRVELWRSDAVRATDEPIHRYALVVTGGAQTSVAQDGRITDSMALVDLLSKRYGYDSTHLLLPTVAELNGRLDELARRMTPQDEFVFVYTNLTDSTPLVGRASAVRLMLNATDSLDGSRLLEWLKRLPARSALVALDTRNARTLREGSSDSEFHVGTRSRSLLSSSGDVNALPREKRMAAVLTRGLRNAGGPISIATLLRQEAESPSQRSAPNDLRVEAWPAAGHTGGAFVFIPAGPPAESFATGVPVSPGSVGGSHPTAVVDPRGARSLGVLFVLLSVSKNSAPPFSRSEFEERLVNGPLKAYFSENAGGRLSMTTMVTDWIKIDAPDSAYFQSPAPWMDQFRKALTQADLSSDLAALDKNNDGEVDAVIFVHDTIGAEVSGSSKEGIWSSSWRLSANGSKFSSSKSTDASGRAIEIDEFSIVSGVNPKGSLATIGVFAHQLGHSLGLHDQFNNEMQKKPVPAAGIWSLMASGSWVGDGARPTHISGPEKLLLGWVEPIESATGDVVLQPVQTSRTVVKLTLDKSDYFVLENRQQQGFDAGLPASGLLVWRVTGPMISLVSADGRNDIAEGRNSGSPGNPFPGTGPGRDEVTVGGYQIRRIRRLPDGSISMRIEEVSINEAPPTVATAASQPSASASNVERDSERFPTAPLPSVSPLAAPPVPPLAAGLEGRVRFEIFICPTIDDRSNSRAWEAINAVAGAGFPRGDIAGPLQLTKQQVDQYFKLTTGSQIRHRGDNPDQREAVRRLLEGSYLSMLAPWQLVPVVREGQDAVRLLVCDPPRAGKPLSGTVVIEQICNPRLNKVINMPSEYWESVKSFTSRLKQAVDGLGGTLKSSNLDELPIGRRVFVVGNHSRDLMGAQSLVAAPELRNDRLEVKAAVAKAERYLDGIHIENCPPASPR